MLRYTPYHFLKSGKTAPNRIALAPMTNMQSHEDGTLSDDEYNWLVRRAKEGFGIVFTCATHVAKDGQGWQGELGIFSDMHLLGLTRLAKGIKENGSLGIVQIFHGGARSPQNVTSKQPWSASAHTFQSGKNEVQVREGTVQEIQQTIEDFVLAAERAYKAGFNGVELHGAHGYLLHQFLSTATNQRTDEWGGNFDNRTHLLRAILQKIKAKLPKEFMVGVRLSPEEKFNFLGIDFDDSLKLSRLLANDGADFIHVSPWDSFKKPEKYPDGDKTIVEYFREAVPLDTPIMVAGLIWTGADAEKALDLGADFVALGKVAIGIPDWPTLSKNPDYIPQKPPYTVDQLRKADLGEPFIEYMKRWEGFVKI